MQRCLKSAIPFSAALIVLLSLHTVSEAYVPQGAHILDLMIEGFGKAKRLFVLQKLQFYSSGEDLPPVEIDETLRYDFPEAFRSDIASKNAQRIHVLSRGTALTIVDGRLETDAETRFDLYKDVLLLRSREMLGERLSRLGVDLRVSSLGRLEDRVVYVVGADYPDETVPQVWIDKETLKPVRWIITRTIEDRPGFLEVRYLGWGKHGNTYYPRRVEYYQNNRLLRAMENSTIRVDPLFEAELFDIDHLRAVNRPAPPVVPSPLEPEKASETQKRIDEFRSLYE